MSTAYERTGRTAQKQRTRAALVTAARQVIASGERLTVEGAADAASISRTTAYRYFPSLRSLLAAAHPATDRESLLPREAPTDVAERLDLVVREIQRIVVEDEVHQRTMLRLSLDPKVPHDEEALPLRQGRAVAWLTEALEPARAQLGDAGLRRLVLAIRSAIGIEAFVWLVDVAGLDREEAVEVMSWTARSLLRAAMP